MRIGLHLYFAPSFGGGERYLLTAAEALCALGEVDFLCRVPCDLAPLAAHFGLDLSGVRAVHHPLRPLHGLRDRLGGRRYDLFIALDNHLAPLQVSLGRRGVLHLQTPPYAPPVERRWRDRLRLRTYDRVVCNSEYTRRWAERYGTAGLPTSVIHPPIDTGLYQPRTKRPIILSVGRFFVGRHEKKHRVLLEGFRELLASGLAGWQLHIAGSIREHEPDHLAYLDELRGLGEGLPVHFHVNGSLDELRRLYGEATVYWHATGHGVDEQRHPQFLEHFGMAIVEAMSAGAIPIVIGKGGPLEIIEPGRTGFFWNETRELVERTLAVIRSPQTVRYELSANARRAALRFGKDRFAAEIRTLAAELSAS